MITIATLRAAGLTEAQILRVVEIEQDERLAKVREQNRIRQQNHRSRNDVTRDVRDQRDGGSLPSLSTSLLPSVSKEEERLEIVALGREWADFYAAYPHKVGKPKAKIAFERARKRASFATIMAGLAGYIAKADDRPWCNPATWLNQDRWADQPGPSQEGNGKHARSPPLPAMTDQQQRAYVEAKRLEILRETADGEKGNSTGVRGNSDMGNGGKRHPPQLRLAGGISHEDPQRGGPESNPLSAAPTSASRR